ncbi:hypothetical protein [Streptomyces sp. NPDC002265]|uniref:hypothetical protein n=1 Tax=Streptomyces sp. NPDC002265 TaxID=3154415 RepID=UPI00331F656B
MAAVVMTLLAQDATFTGGGEQDVLAARAWHGSKATIARAEPAEAEDLMIPPERALARVAPWSEVDRLVTLAQEDDPYAEVIEGLTAAGWSVTCEDGLWKITGAFGNPLPVVAKAAERLGRHHSDGVLVRARSKNRWAFLAWADPYLVLLNPPARVWFTYQVRPLPHRNHGSAAATFPRYPAASVLRPRCRRARRRLSGRFSPKRAFPARSWSVACSHSTRDGEGKRSAPRRHRSRPVERLSSLESPRPTVAPLLRAGERDDGGNLSRGGELSAPST